MKLYKITVHNSAGHVIRSMKGYGSSEKQVRSAIMPTLESLYGKKNGNYSVDIQVVNVRKNYRRNPGVSMYKFLTDNRELIDAFIHRQAPHIVIDNAERRLWVLYDKGLYDYARSEGVEI